MSKSMNEASQVRRSLKKLLGRECCHDHTCILRDPDEETRGRMCTNGGCGCLKDLRWMARNEERRRLDAEGETG